MAWTCDVSIEEKVRQDCYNRGYEQGRKNPCDEIVAYIEELQKQVKEYRDKIEHGTLIELPCKVGDTFWYLSVAGYIEEDKIANFSLYGEFFTGERVVTKLYKNYLGRTWFLTREEAEKRLKELQE